MIPDKQEEINNMTVAEYAEKYKDYNPKLRQWFGRPTKYDPDLHLPALIEYFSQDLPYEERDVDIPIKNGVIHKKERVAKMVPTVVGYCAKMKIAKGKFYEWLEKFPDFKDTYHALKANTENLLAQGGLLGVYNPKIVEFLGTNYTDLKQASTQIDVNLNLSEKLAEFAKNATQNIKNITPEVLELEADKD